MSKIFSCRLAWTFLITHSLIVVVLSFMDVRDAIETNSSGFAVIPIVMLDYPILPVVSWFDRITPAISSSLDNVTYVVIQKTYFAIPFLILGGVQWYFIGWGISKVITLFRNRRKVTP